MSDNSSSNKKIAKNSIFLSIRMVIVLAITLYTTRVVLHELGVMDYGVYNVVCGFVLMFGFLNTSMSNGIQRFFNYEYGKNGEEGINKVYCTSFFIQVVLAVIVVLLLELAGLWYLHNKMVIPAERVQAAEWVFHISVLTFVIGILQAPLTAVVTAHERFDFYAVASIVDAILKLIIAFLLSVISSDKLVFYGILIVCVCLFDFVLYLAYCKIKFPLLRFRVSSIDKQLFNKMIGFSGWNLFGSFGGVMEVQGINLVMNFFFGPIVNAARGVATQVNAGVMAFVGNIETPVRPQLTQSYARGDYQRTMHLTYSVSKLSSAIILILSIPASFEIEYLLHLWLGNTVPEHAATFTVLVILTSLINSLNAAISNVVHATGVMRDYQIWSSIVRLCSIPVAIAFLCLYDIPELALISVLTFSGLAHIVSLFILRQLILFSIRDYLKEVVWPIFAVTLIDIVIVLIPHFLFCEGFIRLLVVCFCSLLSLGLLFYYFVFGEEERNMAKQIGCSVLKIFK